MKIVAQTNFFEPITVWDADNPHPPAPSSPIKAKLLEIIKPVVQVQSKDGSIIYKTGDFYEPVGMYWLLGFATVLIGGTIYLLNMRSPKINHPLSLRA